MARRARRRSAYNRIPPPLPPSSVNLGESRSTGSGLYNWAVWMGALGLTYLLVKYALAPSIEKAATATGSALCANLISGLPSGAVKIQMYKPVDAPWGSGYGMRMLKGQPNCHNGQDFPCAAGTPIYAPADGAVSWTRTAGQDSLNGNSLGIKHAGGWSTGFAHMATPAFVSVGQRVTKGQQIGVVDNTGMSYGDHLHLSVFYKSQAVDPKLVIIDTVARPDVA